MKIKKNLKLLGLLSLGILSIGAVKPLIVSCSDDDSNREQLITTKPEKNQN